VGRRQPLRRPVESGASRAGTTSSARHPTRARPRASRIWPSPCPTAPTRSAASACRPSGRASPRRATSPERSSTRSGGGPTRSAPTAALAPPRCCWPAGATSPTSPGWIWTAGGARRPTSAPMPPGASTIGASRPAAEASRTSASTTRGRAAGEGARARERITCLPCEGPFTIRCEDEAVRRALAPTGPGMVRDKGAPP